MKTLLLVACIFLVAGVARGKVKDDIMPHLQPHVEPCAKEHGVPLPLDVDKFYDSSLEGDERTKYGCLKACMMKRMGTMENANIHLDKLTSWMEQIYEKEPGRIPKIKELVTKCVSDVASITDECDAAFRFSTCAVENDTE